MGKNCPVHHVQGEVLVQAVDHSIALLVLVDKFSLVGWTNVQLAAVSQDAGFIIKNTAEDRLL